MQQTDATATIELQLNGATVSAPAGSTLAELLLARGVERRMIAIEYNGEILPRAKYDTTVLNAGDQLEIVHMVGGG
jgi:sulfur carrier protein